MLVLVWVQELVKKLAGRLVAMLVKVLEPE
jgi:hypothetical protein